TALLLIALAVSLSVRALHSLAIRFYISSRKESLLRLCKDLPAVTVGIEDGKTHRKTKLVIEDEGVCLLDEQRRRLLVEGFSYRYAICAQDVYSVEPVSTQALSGARVRCRVAGLDFDVVLTARLHNPLASLVQAFSSSTEAANLASRLN